MNKVTVRTERWWEELHRYTGNNDWYNVISCELVWQKCVIDSASVCLTGINPSFRSKCSRRRSQTSPSETSGWWRDASVWRLLNVAGKCGGYTGGHREQDGACSSFTSNVEYYRWSFQWCVTDSGVLSLHHPGWLLITRVRTPERNRWLCDDEACWRVWCCISVVMSQVMQNHFRAWCYRKIINVEVVLQSWSWLFFYSWTCFVSLVP